MKLKSEIIDQVNNVPCRRRISTKLDIGDTMLYKHLLENKPDGRLTKMDALLAIGAEVGISNVMELLEETVEAA